MSHSHTQAAAAVTRGKEEENNDIPSFNEDKAQMMIWYRNKSHISNHLHH